MSRHLRVDKYLNEWMLEHCCASKVEVSYLVAKEMHGCGVPVEMLMSMSLEQAKEWRTLDGMMRILAQSWCRGCEYDKKRRVFVMELLDTKGRECAAHGTEPAVLTPVSGGARVAGMVRVQARRVTPVNRLSSRRTGPMAERQTHRLQKPASRDVKVRILLGSPRDGRVPQW